MTRISDWLEARGLGRLTAVFEQNDIDFDVLGRLTERDFKELGLSIGNRKKLLDAICIDPLLAPATKVAYPEALAPERNRRARS